VTSRRWASLPAWARSWPAGNSTSRSSRRARPPARWPPPAPATTRAPPPRPRCRLLGLGAGLTPSGDDYVGGALFARAWLGGSGSGTAPAWRAAAAEVADAARARTHPISAALLRDLAAGLGWAPLHDLAAGLDEAQPARAVEAARRLTRLGHTSGWDLLAGLGAGLGIPTASAVHISGA
jgi:hypothetical protein